jgi:hypothetical protein
VGYFVLLTFEVFVYYSLFFGVLFFRPGKNIELACNLILYLTIAREVAWFATVITVACFLFVVELLVAILFPWFALLDRV